MSNLRYPRCRRGWSAVIAQPDVAAMTAAGRARRVAEADLATKVLITGRPGVGKTTVIQKVLSAVGSVAGGFLTEEIRQRGHRVGFRVRDLHDGAEGILAHVDRKRATRVGKYGVDVTSFERVGVKALREALRRRGAVIVDEIGKMELCSMAFRETVMEVMESDHPVLGTIPFHRHPFLSRLRQRDDIVLVELTMSNRAALPQRLVALLHHGQ